MDYTEFLNAKKLKVEPVGFDCKPLHPILFDFQRDITRWALRRGRAAVFAGTGLGKTMMQLEYARHVSGYTGAPVLVLAPLAVSHQTVREAEKLDLPVTLCEGSEDVRAGVNVTNYHKLERFENLDFGGVVLDESSILKDFEGRWRNYIIERFAGTQYRLACTATPAPNDFMELGNHAEFLGAMTRPEMLSMFFVHDGGQTNFWRLKGHAESAFWEWVSSWAVLLRSPSDLGYQDDRFILPELHTEQVTVEGVPSPGWLVPVQAQTLPERREARKATVGDRVAACAEIVAREPNEPWIVWCGLNAESEALTKAIPGAVEVRGSDSPEDKVDAALGFTDGRIRILVTKPSMFGHGMNWQHCARVAFVGLSDSWEQYYQAIRRCWRFGQARAVHCYVVTADTEGAVVSNIERKDRDAARMAEAMVEHTKKITSQNIRGIEMTRSNYEVETAQGENWTLHLGDTVEHITELEDNEVGLSVFSPPFASLYTYSNSERDMGNCRTHEEFGQHFAFLISELLRVTAPGRIAAVHCMQIPSMKFKDGFIGLKDFRGEIIRAFQEAGWIFHSEVCIWKDPVTQMQRTKALGLLYKQVRKDSCMSRQGLPDYLCAFRKPGENTEPVGHKSEDFPLDQWQKWASPVWMDIDPSDTLQYQQARENGDERHICPLQLGVIERAIGLWSNPGDLVFSPFAGIGSEGHQALKMGRKFVGVELKRSYYETAVKNLKAAEAGASKQYDLFSESVA